MTGKSSPKSYVIKDEISDPGAQMFDFDAAKTMYGGKHIDVGDTVFLFSSENEGGSGLLARGVVTSAVKLARVSGIARQTPRVRVRVERRSSATRPLGRAELKRFRDWDDGQPETELNFKLYRQATNKIAGISTKTERFLESFF